MSDNLKFDKSTNVLTVGHVEGVDYLIAGKVVSGEEIKLVKNTTVTARPQPGKVFPRGTDTRWKFEVNADLVEKERAEVVKESLAARRSATPEVAEPAEPVETERENPEITSSFSRPAVNPTAGSTS